VSKVKLPPPNINTIPLRRECYLRLKPLLEARRLLTPLNAVSFVTLCERWAELEALQKQIEQESDGSLLAYLKSLLPDAERAYNELAVQFGLELSTSGSVP
jgi:hypothetical protein